MLKLRNAKHVDPHSEPPLENVSACRGSVCEEVPRRGALVTPCVDLGVVGGCAGLHAWDRLGKPTLPAVRAQSF